MQAGLLIAGCRAPDEALYCEDFRLGSTWSAELGTQVSGLLPTDGGAGYASCAGFDGLGTGTEISVEIDGFVERTATSGACDYRWASFGWNGGYEQIERIPRLSLSYDLSVGVEIMEYAVASASTLDCAGEVVLTINGVDHPDGWDSYPIYRLARWFRPSGMLSCPEGPPSECADFWEMTLSPRP